MVLVSLSDFSYSLYEALILRHKFSVLAIPLARFCLMSCWPLGDAMQSLVLRIDKEEKDNK